MQKHGTAMGFIENQIFSIYKICRTLSSDKCNQKWVINYLDLMISVFHLPPIPVWVRIQSGLGRKIS
jgi:hypothetical protein